MPDSNSLTDCCNHQCDEGRDCPRRVALQLHRIDPVEMARKQGFISAEGGVRVHGNDTVRLPARASAPTEAATKQSDAIGRAVLWAAGVVAFVLTGASVFGVRLPF